VFPQSASATNEGLTKIVHRTLLLTEATAKHLLEKIALEDLPPQNVRGVEKPMKIYTIAELPPVPASTR
jgi:hypothetical protein